MLKRFRNWYLFLFLFLLLGVGAFNVIMDPFWIYKFCLMEGINKEKVTYHNFLHLSKAHAVYFYKPQNLILGSSRAGVGLNPEHQAFQGSSYNVGIPGATIYEVLSYFKHFHEIYPVKRAVLALDFSSFNAYREPKDSFSIDRLMQSPLFGKWTARVVDFVPTVFSASAFNQSLFILRRNLFKTDESYTRFLENGQAEWTYHLREIPKAGGQYVMMKDVEDNYISNVWFPFPYNKYEFINGKKNTLAYYEEILDIAYRDNVDMTVLVTPFHARLVEALDASGLWSIFESWKRHLVQINEKLATQYHKKPFVVWDFSGYNSITEEPVPQDKNQIMQWFWESTHFRPELGMMILDKVLGYHDASRVVPDDFGIIVNTQNIDQELALIRQKRDEYRAQDDHREYFEYLKKKSDEYREKTK